jgi:hypothetical protein
MSALSIVGAIVFGYLLGPLFLLIHKKTIGRNMRYGIVELNDPKPDKFKETFKSFFPALMALNLAFIIAQSTTIQTAIMDPQYYGLPGDEMRLIFFFLSFTSIIGIGLFSGAWMLDNCGLIYSNEALVAKKKKIKEARSVGGWYIYFLKGYAGISVLISLYSFLMDYINAGIQISGFFFVGALPFVIVIIMLPSIIILDITSDHRKNYMQKFLRKLDITEGLAVKVEKTN